MPSSTTADPGATVGRRRCPGCCTRAAAAPGRSAVRAAAAMRRRAVGPMGRFDAAGGASVPGRWVRPRRAGPGCAGPRGEGHRHVLDAADEVRAQASRPSPASCHVGHAARGPRSKISRSSMRARLAPRQKCGPPPPNAMCSFGRAVDVEAEGVVEHVLVAVGRDVPHHDLVAGLDLLAADLGVGGGGAAEVEHRRRPAQDLLDGAVEQPLGSRARAGVLLGVARSARACRARSRCGWSRCRPRRAAGRTCRTRAR